MKLRYEDFRTVTRDTTLASPTGDAETIRTAARTCLKRVTLDRKLRLLGVRAGSLVHSAQRGQPSDPDPSCATETRASASLRLFD